MKNKVYIGNPGDAIPLLNKYMRKKTEHFGVLVLNAFHEVVCEKLLFMGSEDKCLVVPRVIFWEACKKNGRAIIIYHNHPSGHCEPSSYDIEVTQKIKKCSDVMGIELLDHIIIGCHSYYSFLEHDCVLSTHDEEVEVAER